MKNIIYKLSFFLIVGVLLCACKKKEMDDKNSCSSISLTTKLTYETAGVKYSSITFFETNDGGYFMRLTKEYGDDNHYIFKLNSNFEVEFSQIIEENIASIAELPNGNYLVSGRHGNGKLFLMTGDFSEIEPLNVDFVTPPLIEHIDGGLLLIAGSTIYATEVYRYNYELEEIWHKTFDPSNRSSFHYDEATAQMFIINIAWQVVILDVTTGNIVNTIPSNGYHITDVTFHEGFLYTSGYQGPIGECAKNINAIKMDLTGNIVWHQQFGTEDADDYAWDVIIHNDYVYIGGNFGENCSSNYGGYPNLCLAKFSLDGRKIGCYTELNNSKDNVLGKLLVNSNNTLMVTSIGDSPVTHDKRAIVFEVD